MGAQRSQLIHVIIFAPQWPCVKERETKRSSSCPASILYTILLAIWFILSVIQLQISPGVNHWFVLLTIIPSVVSLVLAVRISLFPWPAVSVWHPTLTPMSPVNGSTTREQCHLTSDPREYQGSRKRHRHHIRYFSRI
jgi:hypothetical protein